MNDQLQFDAAAALGHELEWDPPHELSNARRWTCKRCGRALLCFQGNWYGSALETQCIDVEVLA